MAHFAKLDENNIVTKVIVVNNQDVLNNGGDYSSESETWVSNNFGGGVWKQTSYNTKNGKYFTPNQNWVEDPDQSQMKRYNYAGIGFTYDSSADAFIPPQTYPSWTLNTNSYTWQAPIAFPTVTSYTSGENVIYYTISWDEDNQRWKTYNYTGENENMIKNQDLIWNTSTSQWDVLGG
jgi:hypothetical protein|tara:strand:+ start:66 stop:599 length:534 start_codon:yes stop_codon:yes gene_type:complete